jgi:HK97 family phage portal protein
VLLGEQYNNMGLFDVFKKKGINPYPTNVVQMVGTNTSAIQNYTGLSYVNEGYLGNADVYSIVSFLARKSASIPWYVYQLNPGEKARTNLMRYKQLSKGVANRGAYEQALIARKNAYSENIIMGTPLARLLEKPNNYQSQDQFFENLFGYRYLSGEGNVYGNDGNLGGTFSELNILPTQYLEIYPDPKDVYNILGYKLQVGGGVDLPKEKVMMWKSWNPDFDVTTRTHLRGLSPLRAAYKTLRMSNNAADASATMTGNGGAKGAITPRPLGNIVPSFTIEQANDIKRAVNENLNGVDNKGKVAVLQTPWDYLNFGLSSVDMELVNTLRMSMHQWCRVFGLPAVLFDVDTSSYNNYQNAMRDLITNTIIPMCCQLRDELNKFLVPRYGEDVFIDFDITALPEMQQDMERMVRSLRDANWLTFDEKRVAMNYQEKEGAFEYAYINQGLIPIEQAVMDLTIPPSENIEDGMDNGMDNVANNRRGDNAERDDEVSQAEERAQLRARDEDDDIIEDSI